MPKPNSKIQNTEKSVVINNSDEQWAKFETWMARQGCTSLAEGFRAAMNFIVWYFKTEKPESQEKTTV